MDRIIKVGLLMSIPILFFAVLIASFIVVKTSVPANFFTVMGIPILITAIVFSLFVYKRKAQEKKGKLIKLYPSATSLKITIIVLIFATFGFIASGIRRLCQNDISFGLYWIGIGILCIISIILTWKKLRKREG
jgi:hypothetical protein